MEHLSIYKASAGSGKTFSLAGEYLKLIFNPENKFSSILAVTFTNKATAEMRERILKELNLLAKGQKSDHSENLQKAFGFDDKELKTRAGILINQILHNYSRFNISTIDSFFQRILKAFAYETGLNASFNVELNLKSVLEQSIEQFFEQVKDKSELKQWLSAHAIKKIEDGKSWDIEKDIFQFSYDAFNEVFFSFSEEQFSEFSNMDNHRVYKKALLKNINEFIQKLQVLGEKAQKHIELCNLELGDFSNGKTGVAGFITKLANVNTYTIKEPGARVLKAFNSDDGIDGWCTKTSKKKDEIQACVNSGLQNIVSEVVNHFNDNYEQFNTAKTIQQSIDVFAVIIEVFNQMNALCREKNIFLLPMASPLLSKMIANDDAPFIYEKTGEYLKFFMIDEFQDTSRIQWDNFAPLFMNGIAEGNHSLVVGDVKQSIYRWRNGDWKLLNHELAYKFHNFGVKDINLEFNWRSTPEVISFNNAVFTNIASLAKEYLQSKQAPDEILNNQFDIISKVYQSAIQKTPERNQHKKGFVTVDFLAESKINDENTQWYLDKLIETITQLIDSGTQPKDIAILVRRWKEGALIAKHLMDYIKIHPERKEQFSFVSNDSVLLGSSTIVLLLIALLEFLHNNDNKESRASVIYFYTLLSKTASEASLRLVEIDINNIDDFLNALPKEFSENKIKLSQLPLATLINKLLGIFIYTNNINDINHQLPFIQTFQDIVLNFTQNNDSDISEFLTWWKEFGVDTPINLSEEQNAIRIITIHKSKGLEYKSVLIPFANWGLDQLPSYMWCKPPEDFNQFSVVPVKYSSKLAKTAFKNEYWVEKTMALMDNLNILYVAFTRAEKSLHIFAPKPKKDNEFSRISDLLFSLVRLNKNFEEYWNDEELSFKYGELIKEMSEDTTSMANKISQVENFGNQNLKIRLSANQYFKNENGETTKKINKGSIYHAILERINTFSDIEKAIIQTPNTAYLTANEIRLFKDSLNKASNTPVTMNWFNGTYKVLNEKNILLKGGKTKRPDRVMLDLNTIIVVDYKFTKSKTKEHLIQVKDYMEEIKGIENLPVKGYVWYVLENEIKEVE